MDQYFLPVLLAASLLGSHWAFKAKKLNIVHHNSLYVIALGLISVSLATLAKMTLDPLGADSGTLQRMLVNLAIYAAMPMILTAVLCIGLEKQISLAGWGRWLLALFALFELLRRMDQGAIYTQTLMLTEVAGLVVALWLFRASKIRIPLVIVTLNAAAITLLYFQQDTALVSLLGAVAAMALGYAALLIGRSVVQ